MRKLWFNNLNQTWLFSPYEAIKAPGDGATKVVKQVITSTMVFIMFPLFSLQLKVLMISFCGY